MQWSLFATVFITVFLAELGDKTQLSAMLFAGKESGGALTVFVAASLALVVSTAIAVVLGSWLANSIDTQLLTRIAGVAFIIIGVITLIKS